jgi:gamma-glutamyltranspeptidase/glutathione hydrolase
MAPNGMVASPHALASAAGVDALRAGGSAVDAAIATAAALAVLYPHMTSVGGDAFWLIYDAQARRVRYLNGGGRAARSGNIGWFSSRGMNEIPLRGFLPATLSVPGGVASWCAAHEEYGRLPLARDLAAAIGYAREGFPVTGRLARAIELHAADKALNAQALAIFTPGGTAPRAGAKLANPGLALVLERIAAAGHEGFYAGETARALAGFSRAGGGFFDEEDFAAQRASWGEPISGTYRGVEILETPPPTQGFTVLEMLNLIEPYGIGEMDPLGPELAHLLVQAKQIAYHDRDRLLADPEFAPVPVERLVSKSYATDRRNMIRAERALPWDLVPSHGTLAGDTVFVCAVDREGNAAALIQSLYFTFGSGVVAGDTGIMLQNRSAYFSLDPEHPNHLEPGKRPMHTLIASMALKEGRPWQVLGCMGADGQPQIHLQTYVGLIDFGFDIQRAIEAPRWLSGRFNIGDSRDLLHRRAFSRGDRERAETKGPFGEPLARLVRAGRPRARYLHRPRVRVARRRRRSQKRRGGCRLLRLRPRPEFVQAPRPVRAQRVVLVHEIDVSTLKGLCSKLRGPGAKVGVVVVRSPKSEIPAIRSCDEGSIAFVGVGHAQYRLSFSEGIVHFGILPGLIAEFERRALTGGQQREKVLQPGQVLLEKRGQLEEDHAELLAQCPGTPQELRDIGFSLLQTLHVGDAPRRLEGEAEVRRHFARPAREHRLRRHAIEGVVDLHRRKALGVVAQHGVPGEFFRVELAQPFLVGKAARSRQQLHRGDFVPFDRFKIPRQQRCGLSS